MGKLYVTNMFSGVQKELGFTKEVKEEEKKKQDKKKEEAEEEKEKEDKATRSIKNWFHYFLNYISDKQKPSTVEDYIHSLNVIIKSHN